MIRSLQARLAAALLLSLVAVFALSWFAMSGAIRSLSEDIIVSRLAHDADTLLAAIRLDSSGEASLDPARVNQIYQRPFGGHYYKVTVADSVIRSRSLWDHTLLTPVLEAGETRRLHQVGPKDQPLLVEVRGFQTGGSAVTIAVAEELTTVEANIAAFQRYFTIAAGIALLMLILLQIAIVRGGMRPLKRVQRELRELERGAVSSLNTDVPTEVIPLVGEINRLVRVLGQRLGRSRNALGDLAHALKTPLTILQRLRNDDALAGHEQVRMTLDTQTTSMQRLIDRVLARARIAGGGPPGSWFTPNTEIPTLIEALKNLHRHKSLAFDVNLPVNCEPLELDREDMLELIGNVMDNACKWAEERVRLTLAVGETLNIDIEDDGPGVEDKAYEAIQQRGIRLDETAEGQGLGLAIVGEIVTQYRGDIRIERSAALGGLRVALDIPLHRMHTASST
ncbi:MAG: ATP-binding protein [Gammaproteobacteria bacterium]|nr:ATP-binding protein [Gammaproteobacteria bacterium]